jgi:DNA-binding transcriptional MerR regulator
MTQPRQTNAAPQDEPELMGIRDMCAAFDVTARTLRFYESKELLSPRRVGQTRLFTRRDRARLKLILRGKRFGFALEEIRELLDLYDRDDRQLVQLRKTYALARERLAEMEARRAELDEAIRDLRAELDWGAGVLAEAEGKGRPRA